MPCRDWGDTASDWHQAEQRHQACPCATPDHPLDTDRRADAPIAHQSIPTGIDFLPVLHGVSLCLEDGTLALCTQHEYAATKAMRHTYAAVGTTSTGVILVSDEPASMAAIA